MACMCGDLMCPSCGPAQGNHRCRYCGAWEADGGCAEPEKCRQEGEAEAAYFAEPVVCEECGKEGNRGWFADFSFRGPDNETHDRWLCPGCERVVIDEALSQIRD